MSIHDYATHGDCDRLRGELQKGVPVDARDEQDRTPLACAACSPEADEEMLRLLIASGADVNAEVEESKHTPFSLAACSGSLSKTKYLADAGANANFAAPHGYTPLIHVIYALHSNENLVRVVDLLARNGATLDCETDYGESPLSVALRLDRFDAVSYLLDAGADPSPLHWSAMHKAIALGTCEDVQRLVHGRQGLDARDRFDRTPWLLAACVGDLSKAKLLQSLGEDLNGRDRMGDTALTICSAKGNTNMVRWLVEHGADIEAVNDFGHSALMLAAQAGGADCVRFLLESGAVANGTSQCDETAISLAANEAVARLLIEAGADFGDIGTELKRMIIGLTDGAALRSHQSEYLAGRDRRFGKSNPEVMNVPFWSDMVRAGVSAYQARSQFNDTDRLRKPVWCFSRFGMSFTELPDGRFVQIGGEHEDSYDPDFCIYNDVVIHDRSGRFEIMGYPEHVFPPTDFHSATFVDGCIYIIGRLGYHGTRAFGSTPVFRLNCLTWKIEPIKTRGNNPGWIFKHKAWSDSVSNLFISGGTICRELNGNEQNDENEARFRLDLNDMQWTRL